MSLKKKYPICDLLSIRSVAWTRSNSRDCSKRVHLSLEFTSNISIMRSTSLSMGGGAVWAAKNLVNCTPYQTIPQSYIHAEEKSEQKHGKFKLNVNVRTFTFFRNKKSLTIEALGGEVVFYRASIIILCCYSSLIRWLIVILGARMDKNLILNPF